MRRPGADRGRQRGGADRARDPVLASIKFLPVDASVLPTSASAHQVDDALRTQFPPGPHLAARGRRRRARRLAAGRALAARIARLPDVVRGRARAARRRRTLAARRRARRADRYSDRDAAARARGPRAPGAVLRRRRRARPRPSSTSSTASRAHLPLVLAVVIASTLIVLFLMTGSVVLPVKAVLMNVLSLSAVFGILVLIFQDGNLAGPALLPVATARSTRPSRSCCSRSASAWRPTTACSCSRGSRRRATAAPPTPRPSRSGSSEPGGSSPPRRCCSRSRSARSRPRSSSSSRSSASGPRSRC